MSTPEPLEETSEFIYTYDRDGFGRLEYELVVATARCKLVVIQHEYVLTRWYQPCLFVFYVWMIGIWCIEMQEKMEYDRTGVAENFRDCGHYSIFSIISFATCHFLYICTSKPIPQRHGFHHRDSATNSWGDRAIWAGSCRGSYAKSYCGEYSCTTQKPMTC